MERQERRRSTDFSVPGVVSVCLFIYCCCSCFRLLAYLPCFVFFHGGYSRGKGGDIAGPGGEKNWSAM